MAEDIAVVRRRRMLAFLVEKGGASSIAEANQFSELKLLAAHQAFSAIMEGIVDGGFAAWDGSTFTITEAGRAEAALAPKPRRKTERAAAPSETPSEPTPAAAKSPAQPEPPAPEPHGAHDHGHSHDHGGGHAHDHASEPAPERPAAAPPRAEARRPEVKPPRQGLRRKLLALVMGLLRGR